jgi:hypothetical protein
LRRNSAEPAVLVLADADDVGVTRLVSRLEQELRVVWWRFGLPEDSISVRVDGADFELEQPGARLSSDQFRASSTIVYRRRLLRPRPLVTSELASAEDRSFSEREWSSLIDGLLLTEERQGRSTWLNPPSATLLTSNKLALLLHATSLGLPVPAFSVSTPVRLPSASGHALVTKAISLDERIDAERYFGTALLAEEDVQDLPGTRLPTPSLLQEYVPASAELRVFYALGELFCLALTPSRDHVDIRYEARSALSPQAVDTPPSLAEAFGTLARALALSYCTFDVVIPEVGRPMLVDITPNGDWAFFESRSLPNVTDFLANRIIAHEAHTAQRS